MKQSVLSMTSIVQLRKLGTKTEARVLFIASSTGRARVLEKRKFVENSIGKRTVNVRIHKTKYPN